MTECVSIGLIGGRDKEGEGQGTCTGVEDVEAADYCGHHVRG